MAGDTGTTADTTAATTDKATTTDTATTPAGISATDYAAAVERASAAERKLSDLTARLESIETEGKGKAQDANAKAHAKALKEFEAAKTAAEERAAKALVVAKKAFAKSHLAGLKKPEYSKLAPAVELAEDGSGLSEDSVKALEQFRSDNPDLFVPSKTGTTPVSGSGQGFAAGLSAEDQRILQGMHLGPQERVAERMSPFASLTSFTSTPAHKRGN